MDTQQAIQAIGRYRPTALTTLTAEPTSSPYAAAGEALIELAQKITGQDVPQDIRDSLGELHNRNFVQITYTQHRAAYHPDRPDDIAQFTVESRQIVLVDDWDEDQLFDAITATLIALDQKFLREQVAVDGDPIYPFTDPGSMRWDAMTMMAKNAGDMRIADACAPGCQHDHHNEEDGQ